MKIALIGYGKMGQLLEQAAKAQGHQIMTLFSRHMGMPKERLEDLTQADIVIDFSNASAVLDNVECCLSLSKPIVIGTTGWDDLLQQVQENVCQSKGSCLYAPNFSIGAYLYQQLLSYAANLFQPFSDYDVCGIEYHHKQKVDRPSGLARALTKKILEHMPRLNSFDFSSIRCGHMIGTHTVHFDSLVDTLTLTHHARNRQGFAQGALFAAKWLIHRRGFFTLEEMMQDQMTGVSK